MGVAGERFVVASVIQRDELDVGHLLVVGPYTLVGLREPVVASIDLVDYCQLQYEVEGLLELGGFDNIQTVKHFAYGMEQIHKIVAQVAMMSFGPLLNVTDANNPAVFGLRVAGTVGFELELENMNIGGRLGYPEPRQTWNNLVERCGRNRRQNMEPRAFAERDHDEHLDRSVDSILGSEKRCMEDFCVDMLQS